MKLPAERFVNFFLVLLAAAELDARAAFGLRAIQTRSLKIVGAVLDVRAKLFVQFGAQLRTAK
jgi:hypothetical protein